jgi:alpha-tubulin suppressor-like RCC1 family protein
MPSQDIPASNPAKKGANRGQSLLTRLFGLFSKRDLIVIATFAVLGAGGAFAATVITLNAPDSQGAGYLAATNCDSSVTIRTETVLDAATKTFRVATVSLSDVDQNISTGCGNKVMEIALKINGQVTYASWSVPAYNSNKDNPFYFTTTTSSISSSYTSTTLTPFRVDQLTDVAVAQTGSWFKGSTSVAQAHTCARFTTGVKCWGDNTYGQLGNGSVATSSLTPVSVTGLGSEVTALTSSRYHTCALLGNGTVKCWGKNDRGSLGNNSITNSSTPVTVSGLSGVIEIASGVGDGTTCAVLSSGAVKCWGDNTRYNLGNGSTSPYSSVPVDASIVTSPVTKLALGASSCALLSTGGVQCWGWNDVGQMGDGTTGADLVIHNVTGLSSGVIDISANRDGFCALSSDGIVRCWGLGRYGSLGDGTYTYSGIYIAPVLGLNSRVIALSGGREFTCALLITGAVKCWGDNTFGELGNNTTTISATPVDVSGLSSGVIGISSHFSQTCAVLNTGVVKCWGYNGYGNLGDGTTTTRQTPVVAIGVNF